MARVLVHVQNYIFADMIAHTLEEGDFGVTIVDRYNDVIREFNRTAANLVLMEVTRQPLWGMRERMKLCSQMKRLDPDCKIILIVNEKADPEIAREVRQAKIDRRIDQFIYTSVSASYLYGVMETA